MKKKLLMFIFLFWGIFSGTALASVRLNELAWMGTHVSGANEWIELYNDGATTVDLSGWRIEATDGSPNMLLSGTIPPNGYFLIERTDDTTVPNIPADVIASFGNGLSNSGETLYVKDANGVTQDTVEGGVNWINIGGDNNTKQTAQRLPSGNSWITATATPRSVNVSSGEIAGASTATMGTSGTQTDTTAGDTSSIGAAVVQSGGTSQSTYPTSVYPRKEMTVLAGADQRVFTRFPVTFSGRAMGLYDETLPRATYRWNFGDGASGEGSEVSHAYHFVGEYTVTLEVIYGSLKNTDRIGVVVTDPDVVITRVATGTDGFVELSDRANREIDLSLWSLVSTENDKRFFFAPNTILLSGKSVRFPNIVTQLAVTDPNVALHAPNGMLVHTHAVAPTESPVVGVVAGAMTTERGVDTKSLMEIVQQETAPPPSTFTEVDTKKIAKMEMMPSAKAAAANVLWERGGPVSSGEFSSEMQWFFVFMGLMLIALAGFIIIRSRVDEATIADEYAIIEDIIESEADLVRQSERIIKE